MLTKKDERMDVMLRFWENKRLKQRLPDIQKKMQWVHAEVKTYISSTHSNTSNVLLTDQERSGNMMKEKNPEEGKMKEEDMPNMFYSQAGEIFF